VVQSALVEVSGSNTGQHQVKKKKKIYLYIKIYKKKKIFFKKSLKRGRKKK